MPNLTTYGPDEAAISNFELFFGNEVMPIWDATSGGRVAIISMFSSSFRSALECRGPMVLV